MQERFFQRVTSGRIISDTGSIFEAWYCSQSGRSISEVIGGLEELVFSKGSDAASKSTYPMDIIHIELKEYG